MSERRFRHIKCPKFCGYSQPMIFISRCGGRKQTSLLKNCSNIASIEILMHNCFHFIIEISISRECWSDKRDWNSVYRDSSSSKTSFPFAMELFRNVEVSGFDISICESSTWLSMILAKTNSIIKRHCNIYLNMRTIWCSRIRGKMKKICQNNLQHRNISAQMNLKCF